ncbi:hypothetical protein COHA_001188 [Chlorella ohadii]|uniref:Uncharacterized protein n=1 Tax=Chlorella ohadii TaxID=2649997 RepID=A0AAD5DZ29_9CHLO|nr:hypothetical protein COHA_001188 [Chlorella ohadii]
MPKPGDAVRDYVALDADLVAWHAGFGALVDRASGMAVVGLMTDGDLGIELEFNAAAGSDKRALKSQLYAPRDITLLVYLLLSAAIFMTRALPLSALVLVLNICNLSVCLALKGMTDALLKACEAIDSSIQEFLMLPLESTPLALQQQAACLQKLQAVASVFAGTRYCYNINLPFVGSLSVSVAVMASVAGATTLRCLHRLMRGLLGVHSRSAHHHHNSHAKKDQ